MVKQKSLKINFIMNSILTMSSLIFPLISFPYVSRVLHPEGIGKVSFATSYVSYFVMFAQLGIPTYGVRTCAKVRDDREMLSKTVHEILFINIVMGVISYFMLFGSLLLIPKFNDELPLYIIISLTIVLNCFGMEWLYKAMEQYSYITIRSLVFKIISLIAMICLIKGPKDYVIYGGITILSSSASYILNFINVKKFIDFKYIGNYDLTRHMKAILVFFAMACATTIYTHLDVVMLGFIGTDADVGYYNAAVKMKGILVSIVTSLGVVLLPRASYYVEKGLEDEFKRIAQKALNFVCLVSIPLMVFCIVFAKQIIYFLSGELYANSILPMQIIMPTIVFIGLTNILGIQMLVPLGKEKIVLYSEVAGGIVNVIINVMLIPKFLAIGAAWGTLAAELIVLVVQFLALRKDIDWILKNVSYAKIIVSVFAGSLVAIGILQLGFNIFVTLLMSGILFFSTYGIFLLIMKEQFTRDIFASVIFFTKRFLFNGKKNRK